MSFVFGAFRERTGIALIDGITGATWTYKELAQEIESKRERLTGRGKGLVFLYCRNDFTSVAWYLAAIEAGHAIALLPANGDPQSNEALLTRYAPDWICGSIAVEPQPYILENDGLRVRTALNQGEIQPELSLLLSTSGSTGSPKFARLSKANILANAQSILQALGIAEDHIPVAHLPIHYSYGLSVLNSHLLAGCAMLLCEEGMMTSTFWSAVRRHEANSFSGVPYTYQMLRRLGLDSLQIPSLRIMTQAGGRLDVPLIEHFEETMRRRDGTFWVMYGQTEATARISVLHPDDLPRKRGSVGKAIPGGSLMISQENGTSTKDAGAEGELVYSGPNVMMGYAESRLDLEKGNDLGGVLNTGDRARLDSEGFLYILGRAKRDAKLFGLRVNLDEIESMFRSRGPLAAIGGEDRVVFFCEFGEQKEFTRLIDEVSARLRVHRSAFECRRIEALPLSPSGKVNYQELKSLL